ncbi:AsnC family transcriptional regulator [Stenotrophomonas maltophilia]|nr:AsnC family transcriptional regulator [Stenotrophomonas maltophilia]
MATAPVLDSFDRAILDLLQRDNTLPQREIAEAVHLSTPAVHAASSACRTAA